MLVNVKEVSSWIKRNLEFPFQNQTSIWVEMHGAPFTIGNGGSFNYISSPARLRGQFNVANAGTHSQGYDHGQTIPVTHNVALPAEVLISEGENVMISEEVLVKHVFRLVGQFAIHEFAESFLFRGVREFNPHDGNRNAMLWEGINKVAESPKNQIDGFNPFFLYSADELDHYAPVKAHPEYKAPEKKRELPMDVYSYTVTVVSSPEPEEPKTPMEKMKAMREKSREHFARFRKDFSEWNKNLRFKKAA